MARVLAMANPAAASGKTATTHGLATMLVDLGQQVLVVDLDPQASLTRTFGVDADAVGASLRDLLLDGTRITDAMLDTDAGVDLLPASLEMSGMEAQLVTRAGRETLLRNLLVDVREDYDWVLIDCASAMGLLTVNALAIADAVIVPVREPAARALRVLLEAAEEVRQFVNPALQVMGVLPVGTTATEWVPGEVPVLPAIPAGSLALNAYRELAKQLRTAA